MANVKAIALGVSFLIIAGLGFVYPITEQGYSIIQAEDNCKLGNIQQSCELINPMSYAVYGFGLIGIILIIAGEVSFRGKTKIHYTKELGNSPLDILEKRYAKGEITKEELDEMKENLK